ncbi:MAG: methyl-accepting chemotaxis protein [Desulfobulbales bacterium]|nr:methyl-accepting chemotaxis protein [Desulfobulbales bacterium]
MTDDNKIAFSQSIKTQMILPVLLFSIIVCLILILVIAPGQHKQLLALMEENSKSLVSTVSFGVGVGLEFEDQSSVEEALAGVRSLDNLDYIVVFDAENNIFYEHNKDNAQDIMKNFSTAETASFIAENILNVSAPIKGQIGDSNEQVGTLLIGLKMDELLAIKKKNQARGLLVSLAILAVGLIFAVMSSINISTPINKIITMIEEINRGNLSFRLQMKRRDEIGVMAAAMDNFATDMEEEILAAFNRLAVGDFTFETKGLIKKPLAEANLNLNQVMGQISTAANQMNSGAEQVNNASQSLSQGATEQAAALEEITSSLLEIGGRTKTNAEFGSQAKLLSGQAKAAAEKGNDLMQEMVSSMEEINEASKNISKIIKIIDEIAFQTNLLALNAAVEAARAGRHGKGFAVVADEVRNLAARSSEAAGKTAQLIESSVEKTSRGSEMAILTAEALNKIVKDVIETAKLIDDIAESSNQQAEGIVQVNRGLSQIDDITQHYSANAEESAAAAEQLSAQSAELYSMLLRFKLKETAMATSLSIGGDSFNSAEEENLSEGTSQRTIGYDQKPFENT